MSIIEFGRAVHAEMAAIVDAARRGVSLKASNLYTTTFPCHVCARHIVGAGISRVVYIEPYVKSLVPQLYPDSISIDRVTERQGEVRFEPFVGLAPRRYMGLFQMVRRKDERRGGKVVVWNKSRAQPRLPEPSTYYQANEAASLAFLYDAMTSKGLVKVRPARRRNV
jgi:cytidine deaminase